MTVADAFASPGPTPNAPRRPRTAAPKGFEPGVRYEGAVPCEITTDAIAHLGTEDEWRTAVEAMGVRLPDGWRLVLVEARFDPAAWTRAEQGDDAVTRPVWRYRFKVEPVTAGAAGAAELLDVIDRWKPVRKVATANGDAFTVVYADMQIGKVEPAVGGTSRTIARVLALTDQAVTEYKNLAKAGHVGPVALVFPGDGCEGFVSQGGRLVWRTDLAPSEMVRVYRRLVMHAILAFAKVAPAVTVIAVPGNHDQTTREVQTKADDSWDLEAAVAVRDALDLDPDRFGHITWHLPTTDKDVVTVDLQGTIVAVAHGHQARGKEGMLTWWQGQSHGMAAAGDATLLLSGHLHHWRLIEEGVRCWIQAPALDNGSEWFTRQTGNASTAGLLTLTIGRGGFDRPRVLTWDDDQ